MNSKRYNRAVGIAEFIAEGHTIREVKDEFKISRQTMERDLNFLAQCGYGEEAKKNINLYKRAKLQLYKNMCSKSKNK